MDKIFEPIKPTSPEELNLCFKGYYCEYIPDFIGGKHIFVIVEEEGDGKTYLESRS